MANTLTDIGSMVGADIASLRTDKIDISVADEKYIRNDLTTGTQTIQTSLDISGDLSAASVTETSALKYKKDILNLENAEELLFKFRPVAYTWKDTEKKDIGFIADEVIEFLPELIKVKGGEIQGMNYSKITSILVKVVQEQQLQINKINKELIELKEKE
jgi:hypothetical protein